MCCVTLNARHIIIYGFTNCKLFFKFFYSFFKKEHLN
nr:MAG TPA: hypothetical protein [Inoviridae sp.]